MPLMGVSMLAITTGFSIVGAFALSRVTATLLYGVSPSDPVTYGTVALIIALVATAACVVPTRRATRVDPLEAIRAD